MYLNYGESLPYAPERAIAAGYIDFYAEILLPLINYRQNFSFILNLFLAAAISLITGLQTTTVPQKTHFFEKVKANECHEQK